MIVKQWTLLRAVLLAAVVMLGALPGTVGSAQVPSVLEEIKLVTQDDNRTTLVLRFSPAEPEFRSINTDALQPALLIAETLRAPRIPPISNYQGIVFGLEFDGRDGNLLMRFKTVAPAKVEAERLGDKVIQVVIERVSEEETTGTRPIGSAEEDVVRASKRGPLAGATSGESYELVPLKYADVGEVIGLLVEGTEIAPNNVFIRREPGFGSPGTNSQQSFYNPTPEPERTERPLGESFGNGLAIDRRLNAIWISGTPDMIARVKQQIAIIDVPVDSVILETQFVELTEQGARNLGIDLNNTSGQLAVGTLQTGSFLPFGLDPNDTLPSGALQAAIYAQIEEGEGRIVSRPRIAAQSGSTAKIITGDALPILTAITLSGVNGVSQQVQYVNVGVTLQIAPRVSSDGFVTSQIYGVVSSVTGFSQGYPTISKREAETSAAVRDGETFVIGGLTQENVLTSKSRVPILGKVPGLGKLFTFEQTTSSKTELYIVITPRIVRHRRFELSEQTDMTYPDLTQ